MARPAPPSHIPPHLYRGRGSPRWGGTDGLGFAGLAFVIGIDRWLSRWWQARRQATADDNPKPEAERVDMPAVGTG